MESIKKNFMYNTLYNLLSLIIPFITTPYVSRILGPSGIGQYSYTYSIAYYFVLFTMLGLNKYGNRTIASIRDNQSKINREFSEIYMMQLLTGILSTCVYILCVLFVFRENRFLFAIQLIYVVSATFDISWFFFGIEQFRITVIRNIIIRILNVCCLFMFVRKPGDVPSYCIVMAGSTFLSQISLWPVLLKKYVSFEKPKLKNVARHFKMNIILFIPTIAVSLYKIMDKIMIGNIINTTEVGFYENSEKIINIPMTLVTAIGTVMLPRMTYYVATGNHKEEKRYIDLTMSFTIWISSAMACGIMAISDTFVPWFLGKQFQESIIIVCILAPTMIFVSWGTILCNQILIPRKKDKSYIVVVFAGAIINFLLNSIAIPKYKAMGAACATLVTEFVVMVGYSITARKYFEVCSCIKKLVSYSLVGMSMVFVLDLIGKIISQSFLMMIVQIIVGVIYYIATSTLVAYVIDRPFYNYIQEQVKKISLKKSKIMR